MSATLIAVVQDLIGLTPYSVGNVAGVALESLLKKRVVAAREILLAEIARGDVTLASAELEEVVAIIYRFLRSAQEGAARRNLRLLAQVIAGQSKNSAISADEFLYYANLLEPLRHEEILFFGMLIRHWKSTSLISESSEKRCVEAMAATKRELVPAVVPSEADFAALVGSLTRTGLLTTHPAWDSPMYEPSPLLERIVQMVDFEAAANNA